MAQAVAVERPVKPKKTRLPPGQVERFLKSKAAIETMGAARVSAERRRLIALRRLLAGEPLQLPPDLTNPKPGSIDNRGRDVEPMYPGGLRGGMACSSRWVDANWDEGAAYPPGGDTTLMKTCRGCGRMTPPQCVGSSGHCEDCRYGAMKHVTLDSLPSSMSSVDLKRLRASRRKHGPKYGGGI